MSSSYLSTMKIMEYAAPILSR
ncbi:hypothetical protein CGLO_11523 [Colletotrichum gloeosporioides Cg-14]|uniref:Uncharacterized protein n=1 Tax=Colletotrichum gloeosporioides (strain Cg-14) TaxID=1237896 RepID=T0LBP1_COLGC|nr:hypothetical protein CGLO_11523 [Colletotrichum gloeosporioides Cg-14]